MMYELQELIFPGLFLFGAIQGLILSAILAFSRRFHVRSNVFLALLVFTISVLNIDGAFQVLKIEKTYPTEGYFPYFLVNVIPVSLYFFVKNITERDAKFSRTDYFFFLPFVLDIGHQIGQFVRYLKFGTFTDADYRQFNFILNSFELFAAMATIVVVWHSIRRLTSYEQRLQNNFSEIEQKSLEWLKNLLRLAIPLIMLWIILALSDINPKFYFHELAIINWLGLTLLIYWMSYSILIRPELLIPPVFTLDISSTALKKTALPQNEIDQILTNLQEGISLHQPYLDPELSLRELAELVQTSDKKLSLVLNQHLDTNFFEYINAYRIEQFKRNVSDGLNKNLSMVGLASECGFKSKSSFYRAFKKHVGLTPTEYLQQQTP